MGPLEVFRVETEREEEGGKGSKKGKKGCLAKVQKIVRTYVADA